MTRSNYLKLNLCDIPDKIINLYNLYNKATADGTVYVYELPQAGLIVNELLEKRLEKREYTQGKIVPGLWTQKWRPIQFNLVVDAFGVKYVGKENPQHLISALQEDYTITHDWEGISFVRITLDWYRKNHQVNIFISGYIKAALQRFNHPIPTRHQDSPLTHTPPNYGAIIRYTR